MKQFAYLLFVLCLCGWTSPDAKTPTVPQTFQEIPVSFKGRFRAFHAYCKYNYPFSKS